VDPGLDSLWSLQSRYGSTATNFFSFENLSFRAIASAKTSVQTVRHAEPCRIACSLSNPRINLSAYQRMYSISILQYYQHDSPISAACSLPCTPFWGYISWGSSIAARPFAPNSTGRADRIHGWCLAGNNWIFFFLSRLPKVGRKHTKTSTQTPGLYCTKTKSLNSTRPLSRLFYIIFCFPFVRFMRR
jgi:hypothetical protein